MDALVEKLDILIYFIQSISLLSVWSIQWPSDFQDVFKWINDVFNLYNMAQYVVQLCLVAFKDKLAFVFASTMSIHLHFALKNFLLPIILTLVLLIPFKRLYVTAFYCLSVYTFSALFFAYAAAIGLGFIRFYYWQPQIQFESSPSVAISHPYSVTVSSSSSEAMASALAIIVAVLVAFTSAFVFIVSAGMVYCITSTIYNKNWIGKKKIEVMTRLQSQSMNSSVVGHVDPGMAVSPSPTGRVNDSFAQGAISASDTFSLKKKGSKKMLRALDVLVEKELTTLQINSQKHGFASKYVQPILNCFACFTFCELYTVYFVVYLVVAVLLVVAAQQSHSSSLPAFVAVAVLFGIFGTIGLLIIACASFAQLLRLIHKVREFLFKFDLVLNKIGLKIVFLLLSSIYIPLCVNFFSIVNCEPKVIPVGARYSSRVPETFFQMQYGGTALGAVETSFTSQPEFDWGVQSIFFHDNKPYELCDCSSWNESILVCPQSYAMTLARDARVTCGPHLLLLLLSSGPSLLLLGGLPILFAWMIRLASKKMRTVDVSHLKAVKESKTSKTGADVTSSPASTVTDGSPSDTKALQKKGKVEAIRKCLGNKVNAQDQEWRIRSKLVDCSVQSLYLPFKYRWIYWKPVMLCIKLILCIMNIFAFLGRGNGSVGPFVIFTITAVVHIALAVVVLVGRPFFRMFENALFAIISIVIASNNIIGLIVVAANSFARPAWLGIFLNVLNWACLAVGGIASIVLFIYDIVKGPNYKKIQQKQKKELMEEIKKMETEVELQDRPNEQDPKKQAEEEDLAFGKRVKSMMTIKTSTGKEVKQTASVDEDDPKVQALAQLRLNIENQKNIAFLLNRTAKEMLINMLMVISFAGLLSILFVWMHLLVINVQPFATDKIDARPKYYLQTFDYPSPNATNANGTMSFSQLEQQLRQSVSSGASTVGDWRPRIEQAFLDDYLFIEPQFIAEDCDDLFDFELAGYDSWQEFSGSCCCTAASLDSVGRDSLFDLLRYYDGQPDFGSIRSNETIRGWEAEKWTCRNGKVKSRLRKFAHGSMADPRGPEVARPNLAELANDYVISLDGYEMRDFCSKTFKTGVSTASMNRTVACPKTATPNQRVQLYPLVNRSIIKLYDNTSYAQNKIDSMLLDEYKSVLTIKYLWQFDCYIRSSRTLARYKADKKTVSTN